MPIRTNLRRSDAVRASLARPAAALAALLLLACAVPGSTVAQTDADRAVRALDVLIQEVVSGGSWRTRTAEGTFRLIQTTEGWETIRYRVFVQWLEASRERGVTVRRTEELRPLPEVFSVWGPELLSRNGTWYVTVRAVNRPLAQPDQAFAYELGGPGIARRVRGLPREHR